MTTKNLEFKVTLNSQEANKQIQDLQKRLQEMTKTQSYQDRAKSAMGEGGPQSERIQKVFKEHQERLLAISKENLAIAQKSFDYKQKLIDKVQALAQAENLSLEKRKQAQELLNKLKEKELELAKTITEETEAQQKAAQAAGGGAGGGQPPGGVGPAGDGGPAGRLKGLISNISPIQIIAAAAGVASFIGEQTRFQQQKSVQQANISQNMFKASGADLIMSGRGDEYAIFQKERMRALENARIAQTGMIAREAGGTIGGAVAGGLGVVGGAALGTKLGLPLGPLGGIGGAALGAIGGAIAGNVRSGGQLVGGLQSFIQGEGFGTGVERARQLEYYQDAVRNIEAERAKDPFKEEAFKYYSQNAPRFQHLMRRTGMSEAELFGTKAGAPSVDMQGNWSFSQGQEGFLTGGAGLYTQDKIFSAIQGIEAAGGSSAQMRNVRASLDLQRNYGIESAPQILGALSGKLMGGQRSLGPNDEVTKKMLASAFSEGIDTSKFGAETEKFLKSSTEFILQSGAKTEAGMAAVAGGLASFMPEGSMAGISVATEAKGRFEEVSGKGGPAYTKALKLAALRKQFPNLNENELFYLSERSFDEIKAGDDPLLKQISEKVEGKMGGLQQGAFAAIEKSLTFTAPQEKKLTELRKKEREISEEPSLIMKGVLEKEADEMAGELGLAGYRSSVTGNLKGQGNISFYRGIAKEREGLESGAGVIAPGKEMTTFDIMEMARAKSEQATTERAREYGDEFNKEMTSFKDANSKVIIELEKLAETLKKVNSEKSLDIWESLTTGQFVYNTKPSGD